MLMFFRAESADILNTPKSVYLVIVIIMGILLLVLLLADNLIAKHLVHLFQAEFAAVAEAL